MEKFAKFLRNYYIGLFRPLIKAIKVTMKIAYETAKQAANSAIAFWSVHFFHACLVTRIE